MFYSSTIALFYGNKSKCYYSQKKSFKLPLPKDRLYYVSCDRVVSNLPLFTTLITYLMMESFEPNP